ncbi:MAG: prepilin-type N-terminal cleavage/methylation domain-containing protein [Thermoguttaceae bacterium]|jgi:type II secretory pathway pseudopilin PulG
MTRSLIYRPVPSDEKGFGVQGSGRVIANCKLQIANCKLSTKVGSGHWAVGGGQWAVDSERRETTLHPSSFILHPSSFIRRPSSLGPNPYKPGNKLPGPHSGYTLVEILVATAITLLLMGAVVQMFGSLGQSITDSRSFLEASEKLNSAAARLQMDLKGVTVKMLPPRNPDDGEGYFEYIEGPAPPQQYIQQGIAANPPYNWDNNPMGIAPQPVNTDNGQTDSTAGDFDDILMFTTRSTGRPFVGLADKAVFNTPVVQSDVAEVAWFMRGSTLYRRQLLVAPGLWNNLSVAPSASRFYEKNDISVRVQNGVIVPNTMSDLTRRECRYAHPSDVFPFDARRWGLLGLPTLQESATWDLSSPSIPPSVPNSPPLNTNYPSQYFYLSTFIPPFNPPLDFWTNDRSHRLPDPYLGLIPMAAAATYRIADDIILTNVIGFDVKAWEPALGQYVDLGYEMRPIDLANPTKVQEIKHYPPEITPDDNPYVPGEMFYHRGYCLSTAPANGYYAYLLGDYFISNNTPPIFTPRVYDTWSTHYENAGLSGLSTATYPPGRGSNGFDDDGNGIVDDEGEKITSPPYPAPLRGIQVKIRVFEPDSRQIREVTIVQDFLPK